MIQPSLLDHIPERKREKKREQLLALLQTGRRLSKQEILRELSIWNSGDQIMKLRREGHDIKTEMVTQGDNTYAIYHLASEV